MILLTDILEQNFEEAAMLASRRIYGAHGSLQTLSTLGQLDHRVDAHLDGLRVDIEASWALCESGFKFDDAGEVFAGALVVLASGDPARTQKIIEIACANAQLIAGLVTALGWVPYAGIDAIVKTLSRSEAAEQRAVAVAAQAVHRVGGDLKSRGETSGKFACGVMLTI